MRIQGARIVVAGMAKSGLAAVELLRQKGARVSAVDSQDLPEVRAALSAKGVPLLPQTAQSFAGAEGIVLSPGVPTDLDELKCARERGVPIIGEVELAGYYIKGLTIGITGSNGKTTTTALTGHILRECAIACQVGGNIGTPPTSMVASSRPGQWNVLELSSFQLETITEFQTYISVALNVTPDHLDRHHTFEEYVAAKARLFETQGAGSYAVLNSDDTTCAGFAVKTIAQPIWFSATREVARGTCLLDGTLFSDGVAFMDVGEIPLPGRHNIENTLAAAAAARLTGAPLDGIRDAVRSFPGVEHRLEFVREIDGVKYYNDSKATNVDATMKAVDAFPGGLWLILGGKDKGSDYSPLAKPLHEKAKGVLLIGSAAPIIEVQLKAAVRLTHSGTLDAALTYARTHATPGDTVLLAPACASFDQFENYEHRGRVFKTLVGEL
ncbi:MAG: UDP-N-acetylmuramoyl-L-alanine--D-glutamate ligase [Bryobacteraceae bacterium]